MLSQPTISDVSRGILLAAIALASMTYAVPRALDGRQTAPPRRSVLLDPDAADWRRGAPETFRVRLDTSKGVMLIDVHRAWAANGVDRFYNLVRLGYYDAARFFRVIANRWAQFGIHGDPAVATAWRTRTIPDDPRVESNIRGTVAYAFAVPNGRTTQVFINLRDNVPGHDLEPFVPIGKVVDGMTVADALNSEYGEEAGGGIRAGRQDPLFRGGNAFLAGRFPRLDYIRRATIDR
jgi:cyclophilin family peptidyl-prolyl cis-trans isomerase